MEINRIFFTAGHGVGGDLGSIAYNKDTEYNINRQFLSALYEVYKVDSRYQNVYHMDKQVATLNRVGDYRKSGCNCYIELHCNASKDTSATGFEIWIGHKRSKESEKLAENVCNQYEKLGLIKSNRGIKTNVGNVERMESFVNDCAILIESCFITNKSDYDIYMSNMSKFANAVKLATDKFNNYSTQNNDIRQLKYRVICGSFDNYENATNYADMLKKQYKLDCFVSKEVI